MSTTTTELFGTELQEQTIAVRVSLRRMGVGRTLNESQKARAAAEFDATGSYLSARKRLLDTKDKAWQAVAAVQNTAYWWTRSVTVPYPLKGIWLLKREMMEEYETRMQQFRADLANAVAELEEKYAELREKAKENLGELFNESDYPLTISQEFAIDWDYPSVSPPEYLQQLNPELYQKECQRVAARFNEAVALAEQGFATELKKLVDHMVERLQPGVEGKKKVFKASTVENMNDFFERFKKLNIGSNAELNRTVELAEKLVNDVEPKDLRNSSELRTKVTEGLGILTSKLDELITEEPERAFFDD